MFYTVDYPAVRRNRINRKGSFGRLHGEDWLDRFFENQAEATSTPVNVRKTDDAFVLELSAPGRSKENFSVEMEENKLIVAYSEKKDGEETETKEEMKWTRKEFSTGEFKRVFKMPKADVDQDAIKASYEEGILRIELPLKAKEKLNISIK